jgi:plasmid maintenance system antidote protein VapI
MPSAIWPEGDLSFSEKCADTALCLAQYLGTWSEFWMGLQSEFDLRIAKRQIGRDIEKRIHKHVA